MDGKISPMLNAFLSQTKINDNEADEREERQKQLQDHFQKKFMEQLSSDQSILKAAGFPSQHPVINQKTEVHSNFKNFDHSTDKVRIRFPSKDVDGGLETGSVEEMMNSMFDD